VLDLMHKWEGDEKEVTLEVDWSGVRGEERLHKDGVMGVDAHEEESCE
jgi:hypothetical protein